MNISANIVRRFTAATSAKLTPKQRSEINHDLNRYGMDGNKPFQSVGKGLGAVGEVLAKHGLEWESVLNSHLFSRESGRQMLDVAFTNQADSFSPVPITNSMVAFAWYLRESGNYEITAYMS